MDDLDDAIALVYAQPPGGFVAARAALVKELKASKRKDAAARVAAMRRPTKLAWAVGDAVRRSPEPAAAYFGAIHALAEPGDLRQRTADLRRAVAALASGAEGIEPGEVTAALLAVAADPDATDALRQGWLADLPASGGFGGLTGLEAFQPSPVPSEDPTWSGEDPEADEAAVVGAHQAEAGETENGADLRSAAEQQRRLEHAEARAQQIAGLEAERDAAVEARAAAAQQLDAALAAVEAAQTEQDRVTAELDRARAGLEEARLAAAAAEARLEDVV